MTHPFPFGDTELDHLRAADPRMCQLIDRYEQAGTRPDRPVEEDPYIALMRAINDQLISLEAAASIWGRISQKYGDPVTPQAFAAADPEEIHACGTTKKKAEYMHEISCMVVDGSLDLQSLRQASDQEVVDTLVALRGIGLWSAEMLLIHAYERPDVISYGDAAIRRGMCMLHGIDDPKELTRRRFSELAAPYHPYATTASIYLWKLSKE